MNSFSDKGNILIVTPDEMEYHALASIIQQIDKTHYHLTWCAQFDEAKAHLYTRQYDLCFLQAYSCDSKGMELLRAISKKKNTTPILLFCNDANEELSDEALLFGAVDCLPRATWKKERLIVRIRLSLERIHSLRALQASEKKYRRAFDNSLDMLFLADRGLKFKDVNTAGTRLLGYSTDELLNKSLFDLFTHPEQVEELKTSWRNLDAITAFEVSLQTKSDEVIICTLTLAEELEDGELPIIQGIIHDITLLRKEEKLTLQTEKLATAGRLVRTLAHEVRNPLNNILLSVEQIQNELEATEELGGYLDIVQRNANRISKLITALLDTSRPTEVIAKKQDLIHIIQEVIEDSKDRIHLKKLKINSDLPDTPCFIMADAEKLKHALLNIVTNAIEAMEENKGVLFISIFPKAQYLVLQISDNGAGILEEDLGHLFQPYFTHKRNGLGLGLALTYNILQAHKANIEVSSELGKGTEFEITFTQLAEQLTEVPTTHQ